MCEEWRCYGVVCERRAQHKDEHAAQVCLPRRWGVVGAQIMVNVGARKGLRGVAGGRTTDQYAVKEMGPRFSSPTESRVDTPFLPP